MNWVELYQNCRLCPRQCGIDRSQKDGQGYCGETSEVRISYIGPHFGEEPPISGENGSGTVFFSGCSLKCAFCQNHQISHDGLGTSVKLEELTARLEDMITDRQVHNINFVTPDHFSPHVFAAVAALRGKGVDIPVVLNTSGYQSIELLRYANAYADIYLPDFKYAQEALAENLSKCRDYSSVALVAVEEMIRQKGFLDVFDTGEQIAKKGILVRHMIIPGHIDNSRDVLSLLFLEFGKKLPISLMSQYCPVRAHSDAALNRKLTSEEFDTVYDHAMALGFKNLFVQFLSENNASEATPFLPDFNKATPFGG